MGCETLGDYHDIYLYQDILLLADVFEQFIHVCLEKYDSDPAHYHTVPGLAWDASLKITGVKLRTLRDKEMHMFLERGTRGGISTITHRYARANNKYLKDYDPEQPSIFSIYYDANNLYGWAMSQPLPIGDFEWKTEFEGFDINEIADDAEIGYILEVDLKYPEELHDLHNNYPVAPEKIEITPEMLSPYCQQLTTDLSTNPAK